MIEESKAMPTETKEEKARRVKAEMDAMQAEYDNFRYTDAQREQVIEFIAAAMKVLRGEAQFSSLTQLLRVARTSPQSINGEAYRGGTRHSFDAKFLNRWTSIYVLVTQDSAGKVEPYHLQIEFSPAMTIQREGLESLLQLKVVPGWTFDGGNLAPELPQLHDMPPFDGGQFFYSPLKEPVGDFRIEVKLTYLNGPDHNPYRANVLSSLSITRRYLTPEQIRERDDKTIGHLPRSGERVALDGKYVPVFAEDDLTRAAREQDIVIDHGAGDMFQRVQLRHPRTGQPGWFEAGWQRIDFGRRS